MARIFNVSVTVSVVTTVLALGLSLRPGEVLAPFRRTRILVLVVAVNLLVLPALAWAIRGEAVELILPALWGLGEADLHAGRPVEAAARCEDAFERARAVGDRALLVPFVVTGVRAYQAAGRCSGSSESPMAASREKLQVCALALRYLQH